MEILSRREARRLALARAGLLKPEWTGMPRRATGSGARARKAALAVIRRFGYLQLDTVAIAGARSHAIVLMSRIDGFEPGLGEALLAPGEPLFEYWGHEACWLPMELYPTFEFRRREFRVHPWYGDVLGEHPAVADRILARLRTEGPLRSMDLEGVGGTGWDVKTAKKVVSAFWSRGDVAIRQRRNFQRSFDLAERVIPAEVREKPQPLPEALRTLLLRALAGHGWAQTGTLTSTWRLRNLQSEIRQALRDLQDSGEILPCSLDLGPGKGRAKGRRNLVKGWVRPTDLDLAQRLGTVRPRRDRGVLLSPFDPVLWDRARVAKLFGFDQILEIFKPRSERVYGYYCLPVLTGDALVARVDLKADRKTRRLDLLSCRYEATHPTKADGKATRTALDHFSKALEMPIS